MFNREQKLTTTLGKNLKQPQLSEKRSRRATGLRALNLPTIENGSLKTAENGSLSDDGHITVQLIDSLSRKVIAEATDHNMVPNVKGHGFGLTLRRSGSVPDPGIYFVLVEAFVDATPIARACTAMELIDWRTIGTETPHVPNDSSVGSSP